MIAVRKLSIDSYDECSELRVPSSSGNVLAMIISYVTTAGQRLRYILHRIIVINRNICEENSARAWAVCGTFIVSVRNER